MSLSKQERRFKIKKRVRKVISGAAEKPRMSVYRSNKLISVQIVDDLSGKTLVSVSSLNKEIAEKQGITKIEQAALVGAAIAEKAVQAGISILLQYPRVPFPWIAD